MRRDLFVGVATLNRRLLSLISPRFGGDSAMRTVVRAEHLWTFARQEWCCLRVFWLRVEID